MKLVQYALPAAAFAASLSHAALGAAPQPGSVRLEAWVGGLDAGSLLIANKLGPAGYEVHMAMRSAGLINWLTGATAEIDGAGGLTASGPAPNRYVQHTATSKGEHLVELSYAGNPPVGSLAKDINLRAPGGPKDERDQAIPIPAEERQGAVDPIGAMLALSEGALAGKSSLKVRVFDGKVVYDLAGQVEGPAKHNIQGRDFSGIDLTLATMPVAGFKPFQLKTWSKAKVLMTLDPSTGLPLRLESDSFFSPVLVGATALCPPDPDCSLPKK